MNYLEIIIDGYNFLMTTGLLAPKVPESELEKGRRRLIQLLFQCFPESDERKKLIIVFDSATLLDLPDKLKVRDIRILFAKGYDSADELIIEMVRAHPVPKRVLVVSSDHEIQTHVKRRKASFIDSETWLDQLEEQNRKRESKDAPVAKDKKTSAPDPLESDHWLQIFSSAEVAWNSESEWVDEELEAGDNQPNKMKNEQSKDERGISKESPEKPYDRIAEEWEEMDDIFPPGYGEDLLE